MEYSTSIGESIWTQCGASLDMLENAIMMCPEEYWIQKENFGILPTIAFFGQTIT